MDEDEDPEEVDAQAAAEIHKIISELKAKEHVSCRVQFNPTATLYHVPAYSEIYGRHPREFDFDKRGKIVAPQPTGGPFDKHEHVSPNARRAILERTLREGAAWETYSAEYIVRVARGGSNKYAKA